MRSDLRLRVHIDEHSLHLRKGLNKYNSLFESSYIKGLNCVFDFYHHILGGMTITLMIGSKTSLGKIYLMKEVKWCGKVDLSRSDFPSANNYSN